MTFDGLKKKYENVRKIGNLPMLSRVCSSCLNYRSNMSCAAFKSIPEEIWLGDNDHTKPYPDDNGIQFEPIPLKRAA